MPHGAGRAARLAAAGIQPGQSLEEFQRERAERAWAANSIEDLLVKEPVTEKSIVGYSAEKKAALKLMQEHGIGIREALERVAAEKQAAPKKSTRKSGKGE